MSEVVVVNLAGDLTAFESTIFIEVVGDAEIVTLQEILFLSTAFADSYNGLRDEFCNPLVRNVVNVTYT